MSDGVEDGDGDGDGCGSEGERNVWRRNVSTGAGTAECFSPFLSHLRYCPRHPFAAAWGITAADVSRTVSSLHMSGPLALRPAGCQRVPEVTIICNVFCRLDEGDEPDLSLSL